MRSIPSISLSFGVFSTTSYREVFQLKAQVLPHMHCTCTEASSGLSLTLCTLCWQSFNYHFTKLLYIIVCRSLGWLTSHISVDWITHIQSYGRGNSFKNTLKTCISKLIVLENITHLQNSWILMISMVPFQLRIFYERYISCKQLSLLFSGLKNKAIPKTVRYPLSLLKTRE